MFCRLAAWHEAEIVAWKNVFKNVNGIVEGVRDRSILNKTLVNDKLVYLGDSSATQFQILKGVQSCVGAKMSEVIHKIGNMKMTHDVERILVVVGRDEIIGGENVDDILRDVGKLAAVLQPYSKKTTWLPPPYIHTQAQRYEEFVIKAAAVVTARGINFVLNNGKLRNFCEIFRYGDRYNVHVVSQDGVMSKNGIRTVVAYLTSVVGIPGLEFVYPTAPAWKSFDDINFDYGIGQAVSGIGIGDESTIFSWDEGREQDRCKDEKFGR